MGSCRDKYRKYFGVNCLELGERLHICIWKERMTSRFLTRATKWRVTPLTDLQAEGQGLSLEILCGFENRLLPLNVFSSWQPQNLKALFPLSFFHPTPPKTPSSPSSLITGSSHKSQVTKSLFLSCFYRLHHQAGLTQSQLVQDWLAELHMNKKNCDLQVTLRTKAVPLPGSNNWRGTD